MMKTRKLVSLGLVCLMSLSTFAGTVCAEEDSGIYGVNQDAINTEKTDESITIAMGSEPSMLWGAGSGKLENEEVMIASALYDTLVVLNQETGEVEPNLATEWEWVDDTHIRFTLRDDVTMYDGTPLVAEDVAYTANVWMTQSPGTDTGKYIAEAEAEDETHVTIGYTVAAPDILTMMGWAQFGIVSEDEVNALGGLEAAAKNPLMGPGKYRLKEWATGEKLILERNEDYWNPDYAGYFKEIVIRFTADSTGRTMAVRSGDADVAYDIPLVEADAAAGPDVKEYIYSAGQVAHLWYNMGENAGVTKDVNVRKAIDKAIDFDAISVVATAGHSTAELGYAGKASPYFNETFTPEERAVDIEGAKQLLEEAGYADGIEVRVLGLASNLNELTVLQANLAAVGITCTIDTPDVATFVEQAFGGDYDLISVGEPIFTRLPNVLLFLTKDNVYGNGMVIGGPKWTNDEIDSLITSFIEAKDEEEAKEILSQIEQILKDEMVCSNLYVEQKAALSNAEIKGFRTRDERAFADITTFYK